MDPPHPLLSYIPLEQSSSTPVPTNLFPRTYHAYPFLSPFPLPWTINTSGTFRVRRVSEWLGVDARENIQESGGFNKGRFVTLSRYVIPEEGDFYMPSPSLCDSSASPLISRSCSLTTCHVALIQELLLAHRKRRVFTGEKLTHNSPLIPDLVMCY